MVKLVDVVTLNPRAPKELDSAQIVSFVGMASVSEDGQLLSEEPRVLEETKKGFTYFAKSDVLLAKITPCFENGKCLRANQISNPVGFGSTEFHVLRPDQSKLDATYLFYMIWSNQFRTLGAASMFGAAGQKRVGSDFLKNFEIPLPPLAEQKRIAAILDKADAIRRKRQQAIQLADDFLRAVFLEMFGDPVTNPKGWEVKKWNEALTIVNGRNQKAVEDPIGQYPICGSGGYMAKANDWLTEANSVIIGRKGNINSPILMKERFWNVDTAFGLVPNRNMLSHNYLFFFCEFFDFERLNKAVTIPSLTKADLLQIEIPLPPIATQRILDQIIDKTDSMKEKHAGNLEVDLFSSLSQKAFSGQL